MEYQQKQGGVVRTHHASIIQKTVFCLLHLFIILFSGWLLYFDGLTTVGSMFSQSWVFNDPFRAAVLFACAILYWLRHVITLFYLLIRKVEWAEVFGLLIFMAFFEVGLLLVGGGVFRDYTIALNWLDSVAIALLFLGSYLNSFSEIQRKWWKRIPSSKGRCYTEGLFRHSMHINYFGDVVLFSGWCLRTCNYWTLGLPLFMAGSFIFMHIPGLDTYLAGRYGDEFNAYAAKTKKLVPYIY